MDVEIKVYPEFIAVINRGKFSMADAQAGLIRVAEAGNRAAHIGVCEDELESYCCQILH